MITFLRASTFLTLQRAKEMGRCFQVKCEVLDSGYHYFLMDQNTLFKEYMATGFLLYQLMTMFNNLKPRTQVSAEEELEIFK